MKIIDPSLLGTISGGRGNNGGDRVDNGGRTNGNSNKGNGNSSGGFYDKYADPGCFTGVVGGAITGAIGSPGIALANALNGGINSGCLDTPNRGNGNGGGTGGSNCGSGSGGSCSW